MASGGPSSTRSAMSEPPRVRTMRYRMSNPDVEDARSVGSSTRMEDRPNNWDFFDWQPMSLDNNPGSLGVRRETKKGNQQREQEKEQERGQSLLQGSPPQDPDKFRHRTPSTFPRVTAATKGQREAIEHIKQRMTFSDDADEASSDGEKNNERYMPPRKKERPPNFMLQDTSLDPSERNVVGASSNKSTPQGRLVEGGSVKGTRTNNLNAERDGPDSNQIVGRLMQIRDYIKQTTSMMHKMEGSTDPKSKESYTRLASLIDSLKEQERGYLHLLQKVLASREDELLIRPNSVGSNSKQGTDSEATSELDVQSDTTADTEGEDQEEVRYSDLGPVRRSQRPQIEDHLGRHSDTEQEDPGLSSSRSTTTPTKGALDSTLIAEQCDEDLATPLANDLTGLTDLTGQRRKLESDLVSKNDELEALREQHDLLQQMLQQQEQLRTLQCRQNSLMALQQEAETKLSEERAASNTAEPPEALPRLVPYQNGIEGYSLEDTTASNTANSTPAPNSDMEDDGNVRPMNGQALPQELYEVRQKLDYLKNVYSIKSRGEPAMSEDTLRSNVDSEISALSAMSMQREQLQDKLQDLQQKKQQMDNLLQELQSIRDSKVRSLVGDGDQSSMSSSQAHFTEGLMSTMSAGQTAHKAQDVLDVMEARRKLKKLQDVKERLNQLKDLVQYYQMSSEFIHGKSDGNDSAAGATTQATVDDEEDASSMPLYSDYEDPQLMQNLRDMHNAGLAKLLDRHQTQQAEMAAAGRALQETTQAVDAVIGQSDASEPESQMSSSLGAWHDDPDIKEKVGRLKAAKEKLHRLQELVAMVQQTPEAIHSLPNDLAELAASLEEGDTMTLAALTQQASTAAREVSARIPRKVAEKGAREGSSRDAEVGAASAGIPTHGSASSDPREQFYQNKAIQQQAELKSLMEERRKLLALQQELQRNLVNEEQRVATQSQVDSDRGQEQDRGSTDKDQSDGGTEAKSVTDTVQVTFGEPLETVISNEELYGQMRQQRILREELREKKKELEKFMKKDRPKRHYFRNQDNQSDNVSYSNKSDQYGASASEDVTMATWGGSTAGNLESIEENGSRQGHNMEEVDDGYPSDGIQQVEEEEEARDDSDDRDTYTIEEEYSPKRHQRMDLPTAEGGSGRSGRDTRSKGAPFQGHRYDSRYSYNHWAPDNNQVMNNVRSPSQRSGKSPMKTKRRRKTDRSLLEDEVANLREQVHLMRAMFQVTTGRDSQSLLQTQPEALGSPSYMSQISPQAYQQQAMMNLQTNYAQLLRQQQEMSDRFGRLEQYLVTGRGTSEVDHVRDDRLGFGPNPTMNRSPGASSQQMTTSAQDAQRLDSLLAQSSRDQFELKPRGFRNPYTTTGSHASRGSYIECASNDRAFLDSYYNNVSDSETSRNIPRVERGSLQADRTNPFQLPQMLSSTRYSTTRDVPSMASLERSLDNIPIDVIQAVNEEAMQTTDMSRLQMGRGARPRNVSRGQESDPRSKGYRSVDRSTNQDEEVIAHRFQSKASAAARLADQQMPPDPMANSSCALQTDASRRGFSDLASVSSVLSSVPGGDLSAYRDVPRRVDRASGRNDTKSGDVSGFEDLREMIYAEVATLISQNERRPHYLLELFRELQMLDSDYLRQRALYAIQDLVSAQLTEETKSNTRKPPAEWSESPVIPAAEELTPSESMVSTEDDEAKHIVTVGSRDAERFDYVENVETTSSLSTPNSTSSHIENPFAQDSLGDTVIHLDKALRKMREYEIKLAECDSIDLQGADAGNLMPQLVVRNNAVAREILAPEEREGMTTSGPLDQASDGSVSDIPYPRIDTQQLDHQIKNIMREIIPVLKEHMDDVCSQQLIQYIKRLVLLLTKQKNDEHEFVRFFHSQLGASLQDSLAKFEGRKLRECGEDLLVDLSEILFNELAFFKLMQDLDDPNGKVKAKIRQRRHDSQTSTETATTQEGPQDQTEKLSYEESTGIDSSDEASDESDRETEDEPNQLRTDDDSEFVEEDKDEPVANNDEQEALGKDRDDEFAAEINTNQIQLQSRSSAMKIELAPSETKPYTRIGSDEDDEGDSDEAASCDDPSETAVSRDAEKERSSSLSSMGDDKTDEALSDDKGLVIPKVEPGSPASKEQLDGQTEDRVDGLLVPEQEPCSPSQQVSEDAPLSPNANWQVNGLTAPQEDGSPQEENQSAAPETENSQTEVPCEMAKEETSEDQAGIASPPQVNGEPADGDSQEITIDDLPAELHTITKEELEKKMAEEQIQNDLYEAARESLSPKGDSELAGDPNAVKEPVTSPADPEGRQL